MTAFLIILVAVFVIYLLSKLGGQNSAENSSHYPAGSRARVRRPNQPSPKPKISLGEQLDVSDIELNPDFRRALGLIEIQGRSVFITGKAGTGKSTLLRYFRATTEKSVVVLAPTGVAAVNVGGQTIHSFFGLPPRLIEPENIGPSRNANLFRQIETLVIDEVSMVRADLMDGVDTALRLNLGRPNTPFGGVQMVLVGDLFQLPPIVKEPELQEFFARRYGGAHFFRAKALKAARLSLVDLEKVYRQKDQTFIDLLNRIRNRQLGNGGLESLNARVIEREALRDADSYITLTPTNQATFDINVAFLARLPAPEYTYEAEVSGEFEASSYPTDPELRLRVGARVMMLRNDPHKRWVNGTMAIVSDLSSTRVCVDIEGCSYDVPRDRWEKVRYVFSREQKKVTQEVIGTFEQYSIRLAWALTIHKAQGQTFDHVYLDLGAGAFTHGQTYVALSRCRSIDGLALSRRVFPSDVLFDEAIYDYKRQFHQGEPGTSHDQSS